MKYYWKRVLLSCLVPSFIFVFFVSQRALSSVHATGPFPSGLIDWWEAEGNANDSVGTHHGTLSGTSFAAGKTGQAFSFNGAGNVINFTPDNIIGTGNLAFTLSWWMNIAPSAEWGSDYVMPFRFHQNSQFIVAIVRNPAFIVVGFRNHPNSARIFLNLSSLANSWNHMTVKYNGGDKALSSSYAFYINGLPVSPSIDAGFVGESCNPNDNAVGSDVACGTNNSFYKGLLDDIQVYNKALTDAEVEQVFTGTGGIVLPTPTPSPTITPFPVGNTFPSGLTDWWRAEGDGFDTVGNHHGTLNGVTFVSGQNGQAFSFQDDGDVVDVGLGNIIGTGNAAFTVSWWMNIAPFAQWTHPYVFPLRFKQDTQFISVISNIGNDPVLIAGFRGQPNSMKMSIDLSALASSWNHITMIYNGGAKSSPPSYTFYLNGAPLPGAKLNGGLVGGPCMPNDNAFGSDVACGTNFAFFKGLMDDIQVYNRELNAQEVQQIFTATGGSFSPMITSVTGPTDPLQLGSVATMNATFTDADVLDTHTAVWNWGDGSSSTGQVNQLNGTVTGTHTYTAAGVYVVSLSVTDSDGASSGPVAYEQYVVIYNPLNGFVTGAGQIQSPAGAYIPDPSASGRAIFGFSAKYQNGASVPQGTTRFRFQTGGLVFESTSYQWLVVGGPKAQFKGAGTVNGNLGYTFILTAIDGEISGGGGADKFRIKITGPGGLVYDNQFNAPDSANPTTLVTVGSITIHP
jgi:Concanavalin A-like lectin/glucanases superfamily/PKD domain